MIPAGISPRRHKPIESTDIMLQMVESGRGVAALPRWLVNEHASRFRVHAVSLGSQGIAKHIYLGFRKEDAKIDYLEAFIAQARASSDIKAS